MRNVLTLLYRAVRKKIEQEFRLVQVLVREVEVDTLRRNLYSRLEVPPVVCLELFKCIRLLERDFENLGDVDLDDVVQCVFEAGKRHPVAADRYSAAGELGGVSVLHEALDKRLVAGEARKAESVCKKHLNAAPEEPAVHSVPYADRQVA